MNNTYKDSEGFNDRDDLEQTRARFFQTLRAEIANTAQENKLKETEDLREDKYWKSPREGYYDFNSKSLTNAFK